MSYDWTIEQEMVEREKIRRSKITALEPERIKQLLLRFDREEELTQEEMMFLWVKGIFQYTDTGVRLLKELKEW